MSDLAVVAGRCVRLTRRDTDAAIMALALPVMIMLLFVYLFGGAIRTGTAYVTYVVPGVLLLCIGFGAASTAVQVTRDLGSGISDRFRAMDVSPAALLGGQVAASLARNAVATSLVLVVAVLIGFRPVVDGVRWAGAAGVLAVWVLAMSWVSATFGVLLRSPDAAGGFGFFLSFVAYPSSAFVPVDTMPSWLRPVAEHSPVTHVIETLRGLLIDQPAGSPSLGAHAIGAVAWSLGLIVVAVLAARPLYRLRVV